MTMHTPWTLARRAERLEPSTINDILALTERSTVVSLAGGLPSPEGFPVEALRAATERVLTRTPREALQYAASAGFGPLREWAAAQLQAKGLQVTPAQVLITNGSQQGLDLVGKVLIDPGSTVAVESPTYLGALQAFAPYEPRFAAVEGDDDGPLAQALPAVRGARFMYLLPNFQNPGGRCMTQARRVALAQQATALGLPLVEDNPYGDLWYDAPPPPPLGALMAGDSIYLGSLSKVLAPGLRLGYVVAPPALFPKLLQAKQAADLHTPGFNQRIAHEVLASGLMAQHLPAVRARYRAQRDAMQAALEAHLPAGCHWVRPSGGMFFWIELPAALDATVLLPQAVEAGVAYVPGAAFYAGAPQANRMRLSFVTVSPERIAQAVAVLGAVLKAALRGTAASAP